MTKGEEKTISWTRTHEHEGEEHSHTFTVKVKLNAIKKAVTPELDDEVAKKYGYDGRGLLPRRRQGGDRGRQEDEPAQPTLR